MKKTFRNSIKYISCGALAGSVMLAACFSMACNKVKVPDMNISYGPEIGIADGSVDLSGETPIISISAIKSEVGMNIEYLSGVTIANEGDFPDLEIWVDASTVDIFTPGNYTAIYTFNYSGKSVSEEVTVTITESTGEQSASDSSSATKNSNSVETNTTGKNDTTSNSATTSKDNNTTSNQATTSKNNNTTSNQATTSKNNSTASSQATTSKSTTTTKNNSSTTTKNNSTTTTTKNSSTTTKSTTTTKSQTTSKNQNVDETTTTREIVTTTNKSTTESQYIGNYTIELLSGKTVTIRNTTSKYIVSTRTDVTYTERNGYTYKVSKLIITYNTGAEQVLETVEERIN